MKEIKEFIIHLIIIILFLIVSLIIWPTDISAKDERDTIVYSFPGYNNISTIKDDDYLKAIPNELKVRNVSNKEDTYKIYYKYSNDSTVDIDSLSISLDDKIYKLSELSSYELDGYKYFLLTDKTISSYSEHLIITRIWTSQLSGKLISTLVISK